MPPITCKLLSVLLHYPDEPLLAHLSELSAMAGKRLPGAQQSVVRTFIEHLENRPLIDLQADYTALFDLNPLTTMNLSHHLDLAQDRRAGLLSRLAALFQAAGLQCINGELPDHLPLLLEFLWFYPPGWRAASLRETLAALPVLAGRLEHAQSAYAGLLRPMARALQRNPGHRRSEAGDDPV